MNCNFNLQGQPKETASLTPTHIAYINVWMELDMKDLFVVAGHLLLCLNMAQTEGKGKALALFLFRHRVSSLAVYGLLISISLSRSSVFLVTQISILYDWCSPFLSLMSFVVITFFIITYMNNCGPHYLKQNL